MAYLLTMTTVGRRYSGEMDAGLAGYSSWWQVSRSTNVMEMVIVLLRELHREIELLSADQCRPMYCVTDID